MNNTDLRKNEWDTLRRFTSRKPSRELKPADFTWSVEARGQGPAGVCSCMASPPDFFLGNSGSTSLSAPLAERLATGRVRGLDATRLRTLVEAAPRPIHRLSDHRTWWPDPVPRRRPRPLGETTREPSGSAMTGGAPKVALYSGVDPAEVFHSR